MLKCNLKKFGFLSLCLLLCVQMVALCVSASEPMPEGYDSDGYIEWEVFEDGQAITGAGKTYTVYEPRYDLEMYPEGGFMYGNPIELDGYECSLSGSAYVKAGQHEVLWTTLYDGYGRLYVTETGRQMLEALEGGYSGFYYVEDDDDWIAEPNDAFAQAFLNGEHNNGTAEINVWDLKNRMRLDFYSMDESRTVSHLRGAFYLLEDGTYAYVHYLSLGNQYFDADGNFSYREGTVEMTLLNNAANGFLKELAEDTDSPNLVWKYEEPYVTEEERAASAAFGVVLLGLIAPLPFLIAGLCMPRSAKLGYPKYWYALSAVAGVWMLLSLLLLVILL